MGHEGRVGWREHLAHQRQDSQSGHSLVARFPQLEHAWHNDEEGGICDKRYHRDGALCCIRYSPCQVVFQGVYVLGYSLNMRLSRATGYYTEKTLKLPQPR